MSEERTLLEVEDVDLRFGGVIALDDVSIRVSAGEVVGLIGPNGAGKTSLLNAVTGVFPPDSGTIRFKGEDLRGRKPHEIVAGGIGRTFQNIRLFEGLTVQEHLAVARGAKTSTWRLALRRTGARIDGMTALGSIPETIAACGLSDRRDDLAVELPYGPQRKLEIARALSTDPSLLLLDEPTAGMTDAEAGEVADLVQRIKEAGLGIILIEHNIRFVSQVCDRVAVLNFGEKIAEGAPAEIREDPAVLEAYLGRSDDE